MKVYRGEFMTGSRYSHKLFNNRIAVSQENNGASGRMIRLRLTLRAVADATLSSLELAILSQAL
ncbi:hypothetical protein EH105704_15_00020 [Atlantibacter hermannii NBRC 105704]|uniref:Uncharacterized protein n=1 Tax=Atlantibacter hermannii NBRC 105704 TaxID=1115512 RepID=H5V5Y2_ATLHE|nr:hypothetical protein EH105704_15_00020 [Atlantibacter hermannii NBRC 105704]